MSQCIRELTLNLGDCTGTGSVYKRIAARGIIRRDDKYLAIYSALAAKRQSRRLAGDGFLVFFLRYRTNSI